MMHDRHLSLVSTPGIVTAFLDTLWLQRVVGTSTSTTISFELNVATTAEI